METLLSLAIGIGLSAVCGFMGFASLPVVNTTRMSGHLRLVPGFEWIGTIPALIALSAATVLEILAYFIPWLDYMPDMLATPSAVTAGVVASSSVLSDFQFFLKWCIALIGSGGIAGTVHGATVPARMNSAAHTGVLSNSMVSATESFASLATAIVAVLFPLSCLAWVGMIGFLIFRISKCFLFGQALVQ